MKPLIVLIALFLSTHACAEPLIPPPLNDVLPRIRPGVTTNQVAGILSKAYPKVFISAFDWSGYTGCFDYELDERYALSIGFIGPPDKPVVHDDWIFVVFDHRTKHRIEIKQCSWDKKLRRSESTNTFGIYLTAEPLVPGMLNSLLSEIRPGTTTNEVASILAKAYPKVCIGFGVWGGYTGVFEYKLDERYALSITFIGPPHKQVVHDDWFFRVSDHRTKQWIDIKQVSLKTVWGHVVEKPTGRLDRLHRDADFEFYGRDYGNEKSPQEPAMFAYSVRLGRWVILEKVSTQGAKFGYLPFGEEKFKLCPAPWDFRRLAKQDTVELPLLKGSFLNFPEEFQDKGDFYLLLHNTSWKDDRVTTILRLDKQALRKLFE